MKAQTLCAKMSTKEQLFMNIHLSKKRNDNMEAARFFDGAPF
jgi:hypothetical protein